MVKIVLLRHGYSEYNLSGKFSGQRDVPLTSLGEEQARIAAEYLLSEYKIDAIYASDLSRAVNTAKPVAEKLGLKIISDKRLRELDAGAWTDASVEYVKNRYPAEYNAYKNGGRAYQGESKGELRERAMTAICEIAAKETGKTVLIVTHGGVVHEILKYIIGNEVLCVSNCSVSEVIYEDGKFTATVVAYDGFLGEHKAEVLGSEQD